ncbi:MAG TPA: hypothetical protein VIZ90_06610, partial [Rhizobiaceae bacterium]
LMGLGLSATIAIAKWFSERSPADIVGVIPPAAVAALTVALLIATICSTWLRVAAVPVALAGLILLIDRPTPDLFVSEDGRLVGLSLGEGRIAINRARPNEFTIANWQRAVRADETVRPEGKQERKPASAHDVGTNAGVAPHPYPLPVKNGETGAPASAPADNSGTDPASPARPALPFPSLRGEDAGRQVRGGADAEEVGRAPVTEEGLPRQGPDKPSTTGFVCAEGLCLARHPSGAIVAHALDAHAAVDACATASVIVIDDATATDVCRWKDVLVVTKRDLALNGSAAITFLGRTGILSYENSRDTPRFAAAIDYAIDRPFRPWHEQRRFSREARGLAAYQRKQLKNTDPGAGSAE